MPFDPEGKWRPNPKQEKFLAIPNSIKEAFYGGGAGSGKSEVLLVYPIVRRWYQNPKFKQVFQRRTYPELRNEIVPRSKEFYYKLGATFNKSEMSWCFPAPDQFGGRGLANYGATVYLGHCENEDDVHQYDSMEINLYTPDELTSFTEWIYLYIGLTRVRTSDPNLPAIIRAAGMPGGIGHTWVANRFVKPDKKGDVKLVGKGGNKRMFVFATLADNDKIDPGYAQSLEGLPEAEKRAKKYGDFDAYLGQVFEEYRDKHYPDEPENAIHFIEPFDIPDWWPRVVGIDWGYTPPAMTWVGFGAISPNRRLYIYRELHWQKTKIEEWGAELKEFIDKDNPRIIKLCQSAKQDRGQEHTIEQQISIALDQSVSLTVNSAGSRIAQKQLLHEYFRWKAKYVPQQDVRTFSDEYAAWILRNRGVKEYQSYLTSFYPVEEETNLPKIQIFNNCPLLNQAIKSCSHDKNNPEDVAEFPGDDPYDGLRYIVDSADKYFDESTDEFTKIQKTQEIVNKLKENSDFTAYYRNLRTMESPARMMPVLRYARMGKFRYGKAARLHSRVS
jgi:Terminase-like family.